MRTMIRVSLLLNVGVLVPVIGGLVMHAAWATGVYGGASAARQILLAVYMAIAVVSALLLIRPDARMVAALLTVQVVYKLATPLTVGTLSNPVVLSNLGIAAVHVATLVVVWRHHGRARTPIRP